MMYRIPIKRKKSNQSVRMRGGSTATQREKNKKNKKT